MSTYDTWKTREPIDYDSEASVEEQLAADYDDWLAELASLDETDIEALADRDAHYREVA